MTSKTDLQKISFCDADRDAVAKLPDEPADNLDRFILGRLHRWLMAKTGSGADAMIAKRQIELFATMSYDEIRDSATKGAREIKSTPRPPTSKTLH